MCACQILCIVTFNSQDKYQKVMEHPELGIKVVLPHWFDDCFKLKRLVREVCMRVS